MNTPIIGALYEPINPGHCGSFDSQGGKYVRFLNSSHYEILNEKRDVISTCFNCLNLNNLNPLKRTMEHVQEGDLIKQEGHCKRLVLGRNGRIVELARQDEEPDSYNDVDTFTINELIRFGFTYYNEPEEKTIEIEGKKFTVTDLKKIIDNA